MSPRPKDDKLATDGEQYPCCASFDPLLRKIAGDTPSFCLKSSTISSPDGVHMMRARLGETYNNPSLEAVDDGGPELSGPVLKGTCRGVRKFAASRPCVSSAGAVISAKNMTIWPYMQTFAYVEAIFSKGVIVMI